ncbi:MAG: transglycosylase SLT domain-containing protein [Methylomonas sp.]|nr:transglycosylase SLT domain-containing protein [Methylomonas sp.]
MAIRLLLLIHLLMVASAGAAGSERAMSAMRQTFLQAERYINQNRDDDYFALSDTLKDYPLYPYLQYQWLTKHLDQDDAIQTFLHNHPGTRYAGLLHGKWLANLAVRQQWTRFIQHYKDTDNTELQCYFAQAQYQLGQQGVALDKAKQFWVAGKTQPAACDSLFKSLQHDAGFGPDLIWRRFTAALQIDNAQLAKQMLPLLPEPDHDMAEIWLKLHDEPQRVKAVASWKRDYAQAGLLFNHAIRRWLNKAPKAALAIWDEQKNHFTIAPELAAETEQRLGIELALHRDNRALERLERFAADYPSAQEWRVRAALNQQNWHAVLLAIAALNEDLKHQDKWRYWRARALALTGQATAAQALFSELAQQRSFYGFIAADFVHQPIALNHRASEISDQAVSNLQNTAPFQAIGELLAIERRTEASREWWHAIAQLDAERLAVAAKLAQHWQWPSMAIYTIAKAEQWDDMELRFPLIFQTTIQQQADAQQLDPALIFALIRQESAFDEFAGSSAGAIGLMQLLPNTARKIAGEFAENWSNDFDLLTPSLNIKYGSRYFKKLLNGFNGHYPLAIAAYNAGPNRVKRWLPQKAAIPADIWIETIPYKETRDYLTSVIMYALIYQQRLSGTKLKIPDLLVEVKPD